LESQVTKVKQNETRQNKVSDDIMAGLTKKKKSLNKQINFYLVTKPIKYWLELEY